jgi:hypothetical protein
MEVMSATTVKWIGIGSGPNGTEEPRCCVQLFDGIIFVACAFRQKTSKYYLEGVAISLLRRGLYV